MPKYSTENLRQLAEALRNHGYHGLANEIVWLDSSREFYRRQGSSLYPIMYVPHNQVPKFVSDENEHVRVIAAERLKMGV